MSIRCGSKSCLFASVTDWLMADTRLIDDSLPELHRQHRRHRSLTGCALVILRRKTVTVAVVRQYVRCFDSFTWHHTPGTYCAAVCATRGLKQWVLSAHHFYRARRKHMTQTVGVLAAAHAAQQCRRHPTSPRCARTCKCVWEMNNSRLFPR